MKRIISMLMIIFSAVFLFAAVPQQAFARGNDLSGSGIQLSTTYPSQFVELGESVTIKIDVGSTSGDRILQLGLADIPDGWTASFRGGGKLVKSVYVAEGSSETVSLRLDPPQDPLSGEYTFVVLAEDGEARAELPITLSVQEKVPAALEFSIDLPTIKGSPKSTFRYSARLENTGDEEVMVNLTADAPVGFLTKFKLSGQEVTSFQLGPNQTKTINIELDPITELPAGTYSCKVYATGGDMQASLDLTAEVTGQQDLKISGVDGRLSSKATAGKENALTVLVTNKGTASALGVDLSSSAPAGWTVSFDPQEITEIPAGDQVEVNVKLTPPDKTVAGDYMVTIRSKSAEGASESADFRITVATSTLWGIAGIALIAVAVGVVVVAVTRFGRR